MTADDLTFEEMGEERYYPEDDGDDSDDSVDIAAAYGFTGGVTGTTGNLATTSNSTYTWATTTTTVKPTVAPTPPTSPAFMVFDLIALGVIQIGSWDSAGMPTNWIVNAAALPIEYPAFMQNEVVLRAASGPDYHVFIRGVYSKYLTNERRAAMGLSPL